ncbi:MAG: radical SAM protein [Bacillota bacterium]
MAKEPESNHGLAYGLAHELAAQRREPTIGGLIRSALWMWGRSSPRRMFFLLRVTWRLWRADRRRMRQQRALAGPIPPVVAISPTMRCNYSCAGCYSRGRSWDDELSTDELDVLLSEAEGLGILAIVVTGGEPLLRDDLLDLMARHRHLLFIPITNGSLVTPGTAGRIARSGNILLLVSIEGFPSDTDGRRRPGAHRTALRALECLRKAGACYGFAATNTAVNTGHLGTDAFIDQMVDLGCSVGFFTEYVPCGPNPRFDWLLDEAARAAFRRRVLELRRRKPIVLIQFPHDEYGRDNRCSAAGRASLHINSQGGVEPCPFVPISRESIREGGLIAACQSPFLRAIRENPTLLQRHRFACSLFEHRAELEALAVQFAACPGDGGKVFQNGR